LPINDDLIFRSATDGIRAVRYTISKEAGSSGSLSSVPLSQEIPDPFSRDTRESLPHVSAAWADNRLLMTSVSQVKEGETSFRTLVSMDTNVVGSLRGSTAPIFDGVWTGKNFLQVLRARKDAVDEAFILAREGSGGISLLQFSSTGPETPQCWVKTTQRDFGAITILKRLTAIHLWISGLVGTVVLDVYYRPDSYSKWAKCASSTITAAPGRTQVRGPLIFTPNVETINPQSGVPLHTGYSFQFCLAWKGVLVVERMLVLAAELPDVQRPAGCVETEDDQAATGLDLDEYTVYEV
jgi:hypothetical protein